MLSFQGIFGVPVFQLGFPPVVCVQTFVDLKNAIFGVFSTKECDYGGFVLFFIFFYFAFL